MTRDIRNMFIISKYTFFEVLKSKILISVFFLGLALLVLSYAATEFTFGTPTKVALDFGLGALSFSSVGIAIFIGVNIINKEIESRTIYIVLTQPMSRQSFLMGRIIGMSMLLLLNILILGGLTLVIYFIFGGVFQPLILWSVFLSFVEAVIILNIAVFFSLITNLTMSVVYTLIIFTIGHAINEVIILTGKGNFPVFHSLSKVGSIFLPNFSKINIKDFVLYHRNLELGFLLKASSYGMIYAFVVMMISSYIFRKKDLN